MTEHEARQLLALRELRLSYDEWDAAELLAVNSKYRQATGRAYFSAFHAGQALLAAQGIEASSHDAVLRLLSLHFIASGRLRKESGRALSVLMSARHDADYRSLVELDETSWLSTRATALALLRDLAPLLPDTGGDPPLGWKAAP